MSQAPARRRLLTEAPELRSRWLIRPEAVIGALLAAFFLIFLPSPSMWSLPWDSGASAAPAVLLNSTAELEALGSLSRASLRQHLRAQVEYQEELDALFAKEHNLRLEADAKVAQLAQDKATLSQSTDDRVRKREEELSKQIKEQEEALGKLREELNSKEEALKQAQAQAGAAAASGGAGAEALQKEVEGLKKEVEGLKKKAEEAEHWKNVFEGEFNVQLNDARASMIPDAHIFRNFLRSNRTDIEARWKERLKGQRQRGVVVSGGGWGPSANAYVTLYVLRHHLKCTLPIVAMYWGKSEGDRISERMIEFFKSSLGNFEFMDASSLPQPDYQRPLDPIKSNGHFSGWQVKVFSIYAAPFQEVLYLDSDAMPLLDPTPLFEHDRYVAQGNLHWPDYYVGNMGNFAVTPLYEVLGIKSPWDEKGSKERQTEAGQLLFDRCTCYGRRFGNAAYCSTTDKALTPYPICCIHPAPGLPPQA